MVGVKDDRPRVPRGVSGTRKSPQRDHGQAGVAGVAGRQRQGPSLSGQASLRARGTKANTAGDTRRQAPGSGRAASGASPRSPETQFTGREGAAEGGTTGFA